MKTSYSFQLAHITDPHLSPVPPMGLREVTIKRILGHLTWHRKRKNYHLSNVLECAINDLKRMEPDHIAVTGDLVNFSLDGEYERSKIWLEGLGAPEKVSVIPGNHDAYRRDFERAMQTHWAPYMGAENGQNVEFPYLREYNDIALIGVSSAYQAPLSLEDGRVGEAQLARLERMLDALGAQGKCRVVMIHHPVHEPNLDFPVNPDIALQDADEFRAVLARVGAEIVLHGHLHRSVRASVPGPSGSEIPVRGAGSCSYFGVNEAACAHYHFIQIGKELQDGQERWKIRIQHRYYDAREQIFETQDIENL